MENRVGDNAPDAVAMGKFLTTLQMMETSFKDFCVTLSVAERKRLLHARLGADPHVARVHDPANKFGIHIDGIPLVGMLADLALWTGLRAIQDVLRSLTQLVDDTAGQAESEAWQAFLAYYGALNAVAAHSPALAVLLAPTIDFMKTGPRKKVPGSTSEASESTGATGGTDAAAGSGATAATGPTGPSNG